MSQHVDGVLMCRERGVARLELHVMSVRLVLARGKSSATWTAAKGHPVTNLPSVCDFRIASGGRPDLRDDGLDAYPLGAAAGSMSSPEHG